MRRRRAGHIIRAAEVRVDQLIKVRIRGLGNGQRRGVDARAVEDVVQPAVDHEGVGDGRVALRAGGDVEGEGGVFVAGGGVGGEGRELMEERVEAFCVEVAKGERCALGGEFERCCAACRGWGQ